MGCLSSALGLDMCWGCRKVADDEPSKAKPKPKRSKDTHAEKAPPSLASASASTDQEGRAFQDCDNPLGKPADSHAALTKEQVASQEPVPELNDKIVPNGETRVATEPQQVADFLLGRNNDGSHYTTVDSESSGTSHCTNVCTANGNSDNIGRDLGSDKMSLQLQQLQHALDVETAARAAAEEQLAKATAAADSSALKLRQSLDEKDKESKKSQADHQSLSTELEKTNDKLKLLQEKYDSQQSELAQLKVEVRQVPARAETARAEAETLRAATEQEAEARAAAQAAQAAQSESARQLQEALEEKKKLEEDLEKSQADKQSLSIRLENISEILTVLQVKCSSQASQVAQLEKDVQQESNKAKRAEAAKAESETRLRHATEQAAEAKAAAKSSDQKLQQSLEEKKKLKNDLEKSLADRQSLSTELEKTKEALQSTAAAAESNNLKLQQLLEDKQMLEKELEVSQADRQNLSTELERTLQAARQAAESAQSESARQLQELLEDKRKLEESLQTANTQCTTKQEELNKLSGEMTQLRAQMDQLIVANPMRPNTLLVGQQGTVYKVDSSGVPLNRDGGQCKNCKEGNGCGSHGNATEVTPDQWRKIQRWQREQLPNMKQL